VSPKRSTLTLQPNPDAEFEKAAPESPLQISPASDADIADSHPLLGLQPNPDAEVDIPDIDHDRPYRFLSAVTSTLDAVFTSTRFVASGEEVNNLRAVHLNWPQYLALRDIAGKLLGQFRSVGALKAGPETTFAELQGLAVQIGDSPQKTMVDNICRQLTTIMDDFRDSSKKNPRRPRVLSIVVDQEAPLPEVSEEVVVPEELAAFLNEEPAARKVRIGRLFACINELYYVLKNSGKVDPQGRMFKNFEQLIAVGSQLFKYNLAAILARLTENFHDLTSEHFKAALSNRLNSGANEAVSAFVLERKFNTLLRRIIENTPEAPSLVVGRDKAHFSGWIKMLKFLVTGESMVLPALMQKCKKEEIILPYYKFNFNAPDIRQQGQKRSAVRHGGRRRLE
jgi:hypothetical protein